MCFSSILRSATAEREVAGAGKSTFLSEDEDDDAIDVVSLG